MQRQPLRVFLHGRENLCELVLLDNYKRQELVRSHMTTLKQTAGDALFKLTNSRPAKIVSYVAMALVAVVLFAVFSEANALQIDASGNVTGGNNVDMDNGGGILNEPIAWLLNFMRGTGGLLAALLGLLMTLYSAFVSKSLIGAILSVGIALCALYGPDILISFFGAVI